MSVKSSVWNFSKYRCVNIPTQRSSDPGIDPWSVYLLHWRWFCHCTPRKPASIWGEVMKEKKHYWYTNIYMNSKDDSDNLYKRRQKEFGNKEQTFGYWRREEVRMIWKSDWRHAYLSYKKRRKSLLKLNTGCQDVRLMHWGWPKGSWYLRKGDGGFRVGNSCTLWWILIICGKTSLTFNKD